jgi:hypothetical protein
MMRTEHPVAIRSNTAVYHTVISHSVTRRNA